MQLTVPHWRQQQPGECLAACAAMVLTYFGVAADYELLKQQLGIENSSVPFSRINHLRSWWLAIEHKQGNLEILRTRLAVGQPVIIPVDTDILPYWITRPDQREGLIDHTVVLVGIDEKNVYVNDPDFAEAPQMVEHDWFANAWRHHDYWYAVIRRRWPWRLH
jgi:ABC-type bacteriocin/lantibiotic exporter with double-glycine peptidase domain